MHYSFRSQHSTRVSLRGMGARSSETPEQRASGRRLSNPAKSFNTGRAWEPGLLRPPNRPFLSHHLPDRNIQNTCIVLAIMYLIENLPYRFPGVSGSQFQADAIRFIQPGGKSD